MLKKYAGTLVLILVLTLLYIGVGKWGLSLAFLNTKASAVWPPTGLALAAVLLLGYRVWPAILVGAFVVNYTTPPETLIGTSAIIAVGNTLEAVVGAMLVRRFAHGKNVFERAPDLFRYVFLAAVPSTIISATIGVGALVAAGLPGSSYVPVWLTWWTGDYVSDLLVAPLLIICATSRRPSLRPRLLLEALALALLLIVSSEIIFGIGGQWGIIGGRPYAMASLDTPLLIWAAFRFQQRGAIGAACIMSAVAIQGTLQGTGPFATGNRNDALIMLQVFMGINTLTALVLAAVVSERNRADLEKQEVLERERAARAEAEQANRAKDDFLAILSHELRTPLTPVMLTASMLERDGTLSPQLREDIHKIRRNVELEARLIDDLLDLTRVSHGKLQLNLQAVDVHQKLRYAAEISMAQAGVVTMELAAAGHFVQGDPARMQQIFWNLLINAVKFTPEGKKILVRTSNPAGKPDVMQIEISDAGIGIDPAVLPKLFNAFEQGHALQARKFGGLGLGLSITKALVEAHGGSITAASPGVGKGAVFTIVLPTTEAPVSTPAVESSLPSPRITPLRVLLVEDHVPTMGVMTRLLKSLGHTVTTAGTVEAAVLAVEEGVIDLIISDIGLPDASGYELLRRLKLASAKPAPKAIAISGYGMNHDLQLSRDAGFSTHLTKPIDMEQLESAIERATV